MVKKYNVIILTGPPGTGKGTVAQAAAKKFSLFHLSTGDLVRAEISSGSEFGKKLSETINAGHLVSDDEISEMLENKLKSLIQDKTLKGVILDGYPRTIPQTEMLENILSKLKIKLSAAVYIESSKEKVIERLSSRLTCPKCKKIYSTKMKGMIPKKDTLCDIDGTKLIQRDDDKPETVAKRFEVYLEQTLPLINYYKQKGLLLSYDGNVPAEESVIAAEKIIANIVK